MSPLDPRFVCILTMCAGLYCSCQLGNRTVNQRINKNPTLFNAKPVGTRQVIARGGLVPGMTRDEVYLALGNPKYRTEGIEDGEAYEEWFYQKLKPKADLEIGLGGFGLAGPKFGLDRTISDTVRFVNGRVTGYQKRK